MRAVLAGVLMIASVYSPAGLAVCSQSERVPASEASCLHATWSDSCREGICYALRNNCAVETPIVAKIDAFSGSDRLVHLTSLSERHGYLPRWQGGIRNVFCCLDLSERCTREDNVPPPQK